MITVNSSVNFVIYVIFGEKFKRLFFKLFFPHGLRLCGNAFGGRDSPEHTHEDSFMSCNGDRSHSIRQHLHRINNSYNKTVRKKNSHYHIRNMPSTRAPRASSPGPCVYYPTRERRESWEQTSTTNFWHFISLTRTNFTSFFFFLFSILPERWNSCSTIEIKLSEFLLYFMYTIYFFVFK